ncbi:hypothetical protein NS277_13470 [Novosphingobium barchaimii]|nr:hypothetical protein NS277_13470 [Novosphingobium barchaimii]
MLNVYAVNSNRIYDPVTIVAHDAEEAFRNFLLWSSRHAPEALDGDSEVVQLTERDLALQPQLRDAASSGHTGVAWWMGHHEGWLITAPDGDAAGETAPPYTPIKCYAFTGSDEFGTIYVFTKTPELASAMLHLHGLARFGSDVDFEDVNEISPWLLTDGKMTMREQMFERVTGVGRPCEDGIWRIFPADYD